MKHGPGKRETVRGAIRTTVMSAVTGMVPARILSAGAVTRQPVWTVSGIDLTDDTYV